MHCIICIALCVLHSMHCIIFIVFHGLQSMHCIICIIFFVLYNYSLTLVLSKLRYTSLPFTLPSEMQEREKLQVVCTHLFPLQRFLNVSHCPNWTIVYQYPPQCISFPIICKKRTAGCCICLFSSTSYTFIF